MSETLIERSTYVDQGDVSSQRALVAAAAVAALESVGLLSLVPRGRTWDAVGAVAVLAGLTAVLFYASIRFVLVPYTRGALAWMYSGRWPFRAPAPAGFETASHLPCAMWLGRWQHTVGGVLYVGRGRAAFVPYLFDWPARPRLFAEVSAEAQTLRLRGWFTAPGVVLGLQAADGVARFIVADADTTIARVQEILGGVSSGHWPPEAKSQT